MLKPGKNYFVITNKNLLIFFLLLNSLYTVYGQKKLFYDKLFDRLTRKVSISSRKTNPLY